MRRRSFQLRASVRLSFFLVDRIRMEPKPSLSHTKFFAFQINVRSFEVTFQGGTNHWPWPVLKCTVGFTFYCVCSNVSLSFFGLQNNYLHALAGWLPERFFFFILSCGRTPQNPIVIACADAFAEVSETTDEGILCALARRIGARL